MATTQPPRNPRPLALITGASSGIGQQLALLAAEAGYDLLLAADTSFEDTSALLDGAGVAFETVQVDLATREGIAALLEPLGDRTPAVLVANAGHGLGKAFLDEDLEAALHVVDTNVTGTICLVHHVGRAMRRRGSGRILITGSIAGLMPGSFQAVYNGSKAFIDSFAAALRNELKDSEVTVTCLMPGVTDTEFFERADLMDTKVGQQDDKMDPAEVARIGWQAMMDGDGDVVAGLKNKLQAAAASITPASVLAEQHRKMAAPGTAPR